LFKLQSETKTLLSCELSSDGDLNTTDL